MCWISKVRDVVERVQVSHPFDEAAAEVYGRLRACLDSEGRSPG
ncbi:MAG: hypothetical protein ACRDZ4_20700 [Egibacteraceae bacterium]